MSDLDAGSGSSYARDAGLAAIARIAPLGVQVLATPFILALAGVGVYAVWALLTTTINLMLTADLGVVGIMQRYHGIARGRKDASMGGRVTTTVLLTLVLILAAVTAAGPWIADFLMMVIQVAPEVRNDAWVVFRNAGTLAILQLIGLALASYLAAHSRFAATAVASLGARLLSAIVIVFALLRDDGLPGLLAAAYVDGGAAVLLGAFFCRHHLAREVRRLVRRDEVKELWNYAWRNQASAIGFVAQRESDVIMAAVLLPATLQATVASTAQLAAAIALAPTVLLVPLFTRLSTLAGGSPATAISEAGRAESNWLSMALPFGAIVLAVAPFFSTVWLGSAVQHVATVMTLLLLGFLIMLANSVRAILVRAIGLPGIETQSYGVLIVVKLGLGIPATILWGVYGLASSTVVASMAAVIAMWWVSRRSLTGLVVGNIRKRSVIATAIVLPLGVAASLLIVRLEGLRWLQIALFLVLGALLAAIAGVIAWRKSNPTGATLA